MLEELIKSIKVYRHDKTTSPLSMAFLISWCLWNYRIVLVLFSLAGPEKKIDLIEFYLSKNFVNTVLEWVNCPPVVDGFTNKLLYTLTYGFGFPLATGILIIIIYPLLNKIIFSYWKKRDIELKEIRVEIEDNMPISKLERFNVGESLTSLENRYQKILSDKDKEIEGLNISLDEKKVLQMKRTISGLDGAKEIIDVMKLLEGEVTIEPSEVYLGGKNQRKETVTKPFKINVFPVTNSQFRKFVDKKGYTDKDMINEFWDDDGKKWLEKSKRTGPLYFDNQLFNSDYLPVQVNFFEAKAYANFKKKRLPEEKEWILAARGSSKRDYAWEGEFDKDKCNTIEAKIEKTTPVIKYSNGISINSGCYDMNGNVFEWTTTIDENSGKNILKGGCHTHNKQNATCHTYIINFKAFNSPIAGFRLVSDIDS